MKYHLKLHTDITLRPLFGTTWVSRYQNGKTSLDLNEVIHDGVLGWQWHQLGHMQTICTSLQTDNHINTSSLNCYRPDALPDVQPTGSKHWSLRLRIRRNNDCQQTNSRWHKNDITEADYDLIAASLSPSTWQFHGHSTVDSNWHSYNSYNDHKSRGSCRSITHHHHIYLPYQNWTQNTEIKQHFKIKVGLRKATRESTAHWTVHLY